MTKQESLSPSLCLPELLQWAQDHGTYLDERVEVYEDPITGLSFRASKSIPSGTPLANSSSQTILSYLNATECLGFSRHGSHEFPSGFIAGLHEEDPHIIGHFFLIQQYLLAEKSFWWPYIRTLPQPSSKALPTPMWWSDDDVSFLEATNAAPAVQRMKEFWRSDYQRGIDLLTLKPEFSSDYTFDLYKWAATIFGTRSFRPSLTLSCQAPDEYPSSPSHISQQIAIGHLERDQFSILLPVVDIGNHNGQRELEWKMGASGSDFGINTTKQIEKGLQIYNFYGNKSNSELLAGYGFMLPDQEADIVNLKISPPVRNPNKPSNELDPLTVRRLQNCHAALQLGRKPDEEWMYSVCMPPSKHTDCPTVDELQCFSHGLIDTLICMSADSTELKFLADNPQLCMESSHGPKYLCKNYIQTLLVLHDKLSHDAGKLQSITTSLGPSRNSNQELALKYRSRQARTLESAMEPIRSVLQSLMNHNLFCEHPQHSLHEDKYENYSGLHQRLQLLSLECAYSWLGEAADSIYRPFCAFVKELEEEQAAIPRWDVLAANGWANVYWTVWIFLAYNVLEVEEEMGTTERGNERQLLRSALRLKYRAFEVLSAGANPVSECGDTQENEAIEEIFEFILTLKESVNIAGNKPRLQILKDFSKYTAWTQTIGVKPFDDQHDVATTTVVDDGSVRSFLCLAI